MSYALGGYLWSGRWGCEVTSSTHNKDIDRRLSNECSRKWIGSRPYEAAQWPQPRKGTQKRRTACPGSTKKTIDTGTLWPQRERGSRWFSKKSPASSKLETPCDCERGKPISTRPLSGEYGSTFHETPMKWTRHNLPPPYKTQSH